MKTKIKMRVVSPASWHGEKISWLNEFYETDLQADLLPSHFYGFAGDDERRAKELQEALEAGGDILCARGGYGSARLLPLLNPQFFSKGKLCGFSDITAILNWLFLVSEVECFHGPMLSWPRKMKPQGHLQRTFEAFFIHNHLSHEEIFAGKMIGGKQIAGAMIGGNLSVFLSLCQTPYFPPFKNCILFLEDISERTYRIDRMLNQLVQIPDFQNLKGIVLGQFVNCFSDGKDQNIQEVLFGFAKKCPFPVVTNAPVGHIEDFLILPVGRGFCIWEEEKLQDGVQIRVKIRRN